MNDLQLKFFGEGYDAKLDEARLTKHCVIVLTFLRQNRLKWFTYEELASYTGVPAGSVRTRVSNLKAVGHKIENRTRTDRFREVRLTGGS